MAHGQCTSATTLYPSNNGSWLPAVAPPTWLNNYPPFTPPATACATCPALFTTTVCEGNRILYYMCPQNVYTISLCNSANTTWNSYLTITNTAATPTSYTWDDNGCGGPLSTVTFNPSSGQVYYIRVSGPYPGCANNALNCGTIEITCSPVPPPPTNDDPCSATPLTVGNSCTMTPTGTTWATATPGIGTPSCGAYPNNADVWYTAVVPASGNLAVETNQVGATNIAMAMYVTTACNAPGINWTQVGCNADIATGSLQPYLLRTGLPAGTTVYIRVWPEGNIQNGGSFEICAYDPVAPPNDQPCSATALTVAAGCPTTSSTNQNATPTTGTVFSPAAPTCGNVAPLNDVWFTLTVPIVAPPSTGVVINTTSGVLTDAAMAVYTGTCNGTLTQVACSDPAGPAMPSLTLTPPTVPQGTVLYIRVWNKTAVFGSFTICAQPTSPPPNDDPCGAIALTPQFGCLFNGYTIQNATQTPTAPTGTVNVPGTTCGGTPNNDVWFTAVVPPNGQLTLDTDDATMNDAAMQVYRVGSGSCAGNNLNLVAIGGTTCSVGGSTNSAAMPTLSLTTGLVPGETLYIRLWRQSGPISNFRICAGRTDQPAGACRYTLRMFDAAGDGWNGSTVTVNRYIGGVPPPVASTYSIIGANGNITFGANPGDIIELVYTPVGGFQNQISFSLTAQNTGILYSSGTTPPSGSVFFLPVDGDCNEPPFPHEDCVGAVQVCDNAILNATPANTGAVQDLNTTNRGCLITNERQGVWYSFYIATSGRLGFSVGPGNTDYDYGVWGPYVSNFNCPPSGPPLRCSWADGAAVTGLNYTATDVTEGVFGDGWTRYLDVTAGQWYLLFLDNWYLTGNGFTMNWDLRDGASISCSLLPIDLIDLSATPQEHGVELDWATASESGSRHFLIERSKDGLSFEVIGNQAAAGESNSLRSYRFLDEQPINGLNHYRLEQVDQDGSGSRSKVVTAHYGSGLKDLTIAPNPVEDRLELSFMANTEGDRRWTILDPSGRVVDHGVIVPSTGWNRVTVPVHRLESGSYFIVLEEIRTSSRTSARFVKR